MVVISDTSPLTALLLADQAELLRALFTRVVIHLPFSGRFALTRGFRLGSRSFRRAISPRSITDGGLGRC